MRLHLVFGVAVLGGLGCSSEPPRNGLPPVDIPFDFGLYPDMANLDAGPSQDLPPPDPLGPTVTITMPLNGALVTGTQVKVQATVATQAGEATILEVDAIGSPPNPQLSPQTVQMKRTNQPGQWEGTVDLTSYATGGMWIDVSATDVTNHTNAATVNVVRDTGPLITAVIPTGKVAYSGSAPLEFSVSDPFGLDPKNPPQATVQGKVITIMPLAGASPATWDGTIDFHSNAFAAPLAGAQSVHITATNVRNTTSAIDVPFLVDDDGPTIAITEPTAGQIVGGVITITAIVDDLSGVAGQSVVAVVQDFDPKTQMNFQHVVPLSNGGLNMMASNVYSGTFDTGTLNPLFVYSHISVRAADVLGNQGNQSEEVILDLVPPSFDLDPPITRVRKKVMSGNMMMQTEYDCSHVFDPVGDDAVNDGDVANQLIWFRVRADDQGNLANGVAEDWFSGVDPDSLELYVIQASDAPLVVDTNGDGICDDFNPQIAPSTNANMNGQALRLPLAALGAVGIPDFTTDMDPLWHMPPWPIMCDQVGDPMQLPPMPLCDVTSQTYAIRNLDQTAPALFAVPPIGGNKDACVGLQVDALNRLPDGPVCAAVRGRDKAGNQAVSRPIRICIDKFRTGKVCDMTKYVAHGGKPGAGLPDCTGTVDKGVPTGKTPCKPVVKLNSTCAKDADCIFGKCLVPPGRCVAPAFPMPTEPYTIM